MRESLMGVPVRRRPTLIALIAIVLVALGGGVGARLVATGDYPEPPQPEVETGDYPEPPQPEVETGRDPLAEAQVVSPEVALLTDASAIAREQGISVEEAVSRLRFQDDVDRFVASLASDLLDEFYLGGEMIWTDTPRAVLRFKGEVPKEVSTALEASGLQGVTLQGGMAYSYVELQRFAQAVHRATVALGFTSVTTSFDIRTQVVEINVVLQVGQPELRGDRLLEAILATTEVPANPGWVPPRLFIREFPADSPPLVEPHHTYWGLAAR